MRDALADIRRRERSAQLRLDQGQDTRVCQGAPLQRDSLRDDHGRRLRGGG